MTGEKHLLSVLVHNRLDNKFVIAHAHCPACGCHRWVTSVAISPSGGRVMSGSMDCSAKVWDRRTGSWLQYLKGHSSAVCCVAMPSESRAVSGSRDGTVRMWDVSTGSQICCFSLEGGKPWINAVEAWIPAMGALPAPGGAGHVHRATTSSSSHLMPFGGQRDGGGELGRCRNYAFQLTDDIAFN